MLQLAILFLISTLIFALPAPAPLSITPRACTTVIPTYHRALTDSSLTSANCEAQSNSLALPKKIFVSQDYTNATSPTRSLRLLSFAIPALSYGCQLSITDTAHTLRHSHPLPTLNIISLHANSFSNVTNDTTTLHTIMNANPSLISTRKFGTIKMETGGSSVVNSLPCPTEVEEGCGVGFAQFVIEFEGVQKGEAAWWMVDQTVEAGSVEWEAINGLFMTFNC